jgi:hypothetical protein
MVEFDLRNGLSYGMDELGFESLKKQVIYAFPERSRPDLGLSQSGALSWE